MSIDKGKVLETFFSLRADMLENPIAAAWRVVHKEKINDHYFVFELGVKEVFGDEQKFYFPEGEK